MEFIANLVGQANDLVWNSGIPIGGENIPFVVIMLIGVGAFLTVRLGFIQLRRFGHGVAVATGRYDDPNDPGDWPGMRMGATSTSVCCAMSLARSTPLR